MKPQNSSYGKILVTSRSRRVTCWINTRRKVKQPRKDVEGPVWKSWHWEGVSKINRWKQKLKDGVLNGTESINKKFKCVGYIELSVRRIRTKCWHYLYSQSTHFPNSPVLWWIGEPVSFERGLLSPKGKLINGIGF